MAFINRAPLKPSCVVTSTAMLRPKDVASRLRRLMAENEKVGPPREENATATQVGDPLKSTMPSRRVYPNSSMITGSGGGPFIDGAFQVIQ